MSGQVTPLPKAIPNPEMSLFGYLIAAPLVILALPLLPFVVALWVYWKLTEHSERSHEFEPHEAA